MPRPARSRYIGDKKLMELEDEGVLTCYQCMLLELMADIRDNLGKQGMLEERPKKEKSKKK